jgi:CRISPR system Cascade subunit CasB
MSSPTAFIASLRRLGRDDLGKVATLRRSLGGEPGEDVRAFPMVERHLPTERSWDRTVYYLVAGLWASVNTASVIAAGGDAPDDEEEEPPTGEATSDQPRGAVPTEMGRRERRSFGRAVAQMYRRRNQTESIEQRFVALLDADEEQLAHHLRQMVQLLKAEDGIRIHWVELLTDLRRWNDDDRWVQQRWARAFYREVNNAGADEPADTLTQADTQTQKDGE